MQKELYDITNISLTECRRLVVIISKRGEYDVSRCLLLNNDVKESIAEKKGTQWTVKQQGPYELEILELESGRGINIPNVSHGIKKALLMAPKTI